MFASFRPLFLKGATMLRQDETNGWRVPVARSAHCFATPAQSGGAPGALCYIHLDYPGGIGQTGRCRRNPRADLAAAWPVPAVLPDLLKARITEPRCQADYPPAPSSPNW